MRVSDFNFDLPGELIAQHPPNARDAARMLTLDRRSWEFQDRQFRDLPAMLRPGDLVVFNNSRVIPARLFGHRGGLHTQAQSPSPTGIIEVLLTEQLSATEWRALVKPARKVQVGETLYFGNIPATNLSADVTTAGDHGERTLRFKSIPDFFSRLDALGHVPLPPYLHRADSPEDRARYQTVYADPARPGSVAAPTAGLHFTPEVLDQLRRRGVHTATITLHVGLGTFQPVRVDRLEDIQLHAENYTLDGEAAEAINHARREHRRVVAVGTTTVRTLEHCARQAMAAAAAMCGRTAPWELAPHSGSTCIFLKPGDRFYAVDALLTNFHLPQSTLLMLVAAFAGQSTSAQEGIASVLNAYHHAVAEQYRFFSYGDCMFLY